MNVIIFALICILLLHSSFGLRTVTNPMRNGVKSHALSSKESFDPLGFSPNKAPQKRNKVLEKASLAAGLTFVSSALPVEAAPAAANAIPSAIAAYGHYLGLVLVALSLATERILIKPGMSDEDEEKFANADITYGLAGTLVLISGYFRVTQSNMVKDGNFIVIHQFFGSKCYYLL